jgi:hypothetical protein
VGFPCCIRENVEGFGEERERERDRKGKERERIEIFGMGE